MKGLLTIPAFSLMLVCFTSAMAQEDQSDGIQVKILLECNEGLLGISGQAINNSSQEYKLRYVLSVITGKNNSGNSSQNNQSGSFMLPASGTKTLSRTSISQKPGNQAIIRLHLYQGDTIIARDAMTYQF